MNFQDIKSSMLFSPHKYVDEDTDMQRFYTINQSPQIRPEEDIIDFYLANHLLALIEDKVGARGLSDDEQFIVEELITSMEGVFKRLFTYLILISIGETRHGHTGHHEDTITEKFGKQVWLLSQSIKGTNREGARGEFLSKSRNLVNYMKYCNWCFTACFGGGSFGGKKWRAISDKCVQMLAGKISPFTMTDVSWAMVHNTGSIFNKHTIYTNIQSENSLVHILDMQRAGAIPAFIRNTKKYVNAGVMHGSSMSLLRFEESMCRVEYNFGIKGLGVFIPMAEIGEAGALSLLFKVAKNKSGQVPNKVPNLVKTGGVFSIGEEGFDLWERADEL